MSRVSRAPARLGYWTALGVVATFAVFTICFIAIPLSGPIFRWTDLPAYAAWTRTQPQGLATLARLCMLFFCPLLVGLFVAILECAPEPARVWARLGLCFAVIFAAAMSALAGELNSLATATMVDFYQRFVRPGASAAHDLAASRVFTAFWGLFAAGVATKAGQLGSAIEVVNRFGSYFYGSILGVFALAILTPRATARGAFYGLFAGMATVFLVSQRTSVAFLWFNVIGAVTVFVVGLLITAVAPGAPPRPRTLPDPALD